MKLFFTAFVQVFLVAANTIFLASGQIAGMVVSSFLINWVWTHNVKKIGFESEIDRVYYALGATSGCVCGYFASKFFITL
jgi:hypothetical protein